MSGKKIVLLSKTEIDSTVKTPKTKRRCSGRKFQRREKSLLEALPLDILTRILCGVNHDDLDQLFHVSKMIREAALVANQLHFAYRTPIKTSTFQNSFDFGNVAKFEEVEAPNAPKQFRTSESETDLSQLSSGKRKLADILKQTKKLSYRPPRVNWIYSFWELAVESLATFHCTNIQLETWEPNAKSWAEDGDESERDWPKPNADEPFSEILVLVPKRVEEDDPCERRLARDEPRPWDTGNVYELSDQWWVSLSRLRLWFAEG
ncbi:hypothetical protein Acr_18g0004280 [Actinidia rufa]|uniref:F-box family protein n=1 Tax=Actinidia rufa TaxID=165716 RepID=A0A7J0G644_9ERIC|nr:hypothetical protein Acr_18g0004280 [Actinidia rufa]